MHASRGVVLAGGGYPHDRRRRATFPRRTSTGPLQCLRRPATARASPSRPAAYSMRRSLHLARGVRYRSCHMPTAASAASLNHRARQTRDRRRARGRSPILQRGQRLSRLRGSDAACGACGQGSRVVARVHPRVPAALRPRCIATGPLSVGPSCDRGTSRRAARSQSSHATAASIRKGSSARRGVQRAREARRGSAVRPRTTLYNRYQGDRT